MIYNRASSSARNGIYIELYIRVVYIYIYKVYTIYTRDCIAYKNRSYYMGRRDRRGKGELSCRRVRYILSVYRIHIGGAKAFGDAWGGPGQYCDMYARVRLPACLAACYIAMSLYCTPEYIYSRSSLAYNIYAARILRTRRVLFRDIYI